MLSEDSKLGALADAGPTEIWMLALPPIRGRAAALFYTFTDEAVILLWIVACDCPPPFDVAASLVTLAAGDDGGMAHVVVMTHEGWIDLSRAHWAGVENRNHWRRDATLGEDRTRLHQSRALMNLTLLRSVNLRLLANQDCEDWLPAQTERLAAHPASALALLRTKL